MGAIFILESRRQSSYNNNNKVFFYKPTMTSRVLIDEFEVPTDASGNFKAIVQPL